MSHNLWLAGHLPIVRLRRAARHLRVKLGGVRHGLDDGPLAAVAGSCGERPCHLVYGRARCERVLGVTGCGRERFLSVEKEDTVQKQHHARQTHAQATQVNAQTKICFNV